MGTQDCPPQLSKSYRQVNTAEEDSEPSKRLVAGGETLQLVSVLAV